MEPSFGKIKREKSVVRSLRGRRLKWVGKGVWGAFFSACQFPPPSLLNACHAGYVVRGTGISLCLTDAEPGVSCPKNLEIGFLCGPLCLDILFQQNFHNTKHMTKFDINFTRIVFTTDENKSLKSVCKPAPKSLFWAPTHLSTRHDWPVNKSYCSIAQSGWREIRNSLLVISWVRKGPEQGHRRCFADITNCLTLDNVCYAG